MINLLLEAVNENMRMYLLALPLLGLANIIGGALLGEIEQEFEWKILFDGVKKFTSMFVLIFLLVLAGALVNDDLVIVAGEAISIIGILEIGLFAAVTLYAVKTLTKVFELLNVDIKIDNNELYTQDEVIELLDMQEDVILDELENEGDEIYEIQ